MVGRALSAGSDLVGQYGVGNALERGVDILNDRKQGMSPEWRKEWEDAFEIARMRQKNISSGVRDANTMSVKQTGMSRIISV